MSQKKIKQYITDFLEYLEIERNRSKKTIENYHFYLHRFADWLKSPAPNAITEEKVREYRLWLNRMTDQHGEYLKKNTQNYHLIALRTFLKFLSKRDVETLSAQKIELMKMPDREITFLEPEEVLELLEAPYTAMEMMDVGAQSTKLICFRDVALLELLFSTGLRVSELVKLHIEDVNLDKDEFTVTGKGKKRRIVFLSDRAKKALKQYLGHRVDINPFLFIPHHSIQKKTETKSEHLTPRSVQRAIQKYAKIIGLTKPVTPHTLRHSYATDLLQNGADIRSVQAMLGHSSITTTQIYTHVSDKTLKDIHKKFHNSKESDA